jgi:RHS repeat-associated protein
VLESSFQSLPYGDHLVTSGNDTTPLHYTGKQRDMESGNDYFGARYYASTMGRFMSPDWSASPEAVPYSSLSDPQSLNLYAYVGNNPLSRIDADGHLCGEAPGSCNTEGIGEFGNEAQVYDQHRKDGDNFKIKVNVGWCLSCERSTVSYSSGSAQFYTWGAAQRSQAAAGLLAGGIKRLSSAQLRAIWERANPGLKVPFDAIRNRFYDMHHIRGSCRWWDE